MTTLDDLIASTREDYLLAGSRPRRTRLTAAVNDSTTTIPVESVQGITAGTRIAIGTEEMHVWAVNTLNLDVYRADAGTTAAGHDDEAIVTIDPEYSDGRILRALNSTVEELRHEPGLYRVGYVDSTAPHSGEIALGAHPDESAEVGYDGVIEVLLATNDESEPWTRAQRWDVIQNASEDATPQPIVVVYGIESWPYDVRVVKRQTLGTITAGSSDVEGDVGILNTDLLAVGAALRLGAGRAMRRTSLHAQGDARRANEVAAFSTGNATRDLERRYKKLLANEKVRLLQRFPYRRHTR
jgi:hypothetical protein